MIYLIHGEEVSSREYLVDLKEGYKNSFVHKLVNDEFDINEFITLLNTKPLFSQAKRLFVLEIHDKKKVLNKSFYEFLSDKNLEEDLALFFQSALPPSSKLLKILPKDSSISHFKDEHQGEIFKFLDAVSAKDSKSSFLLLNKLLSSGETPSYVLSMLAYQFRNLLFAKLETKALGSLHPFVGRKAKSISNNFNEGELITALGSILEAEVVLKSKDIFPGVLLTTLLVKIQTSEV